MQLSELGGLIVSCTRSKTTPQKLLRSGGKRKRQNVAPRIFGVSVITTLSHSPHFDTKTIDPLPPVWGLSWKCLWSSSSFFFGTMGEGSVGAGGATRVGDEGLGGRLATGRHLSPRLASAHCCQPSSNQQPSMCLAAEGVSNQLLAPS